ncbi:MAG: hypothetical protein IJ440_01075, partial [Alphaproteobacteria bacterium]|nr:hypothetical protein [Alphaproteobacteria bacterium]
KTITGKSNGTSSTGYGIKIDRNCILTGTDSITGSGYGGIQNSGTITATGITITGTGTVAYGIYNNYSSAKISAATIIGTSTSTGTWSGIAASYGTITATTSVIGTGTIGIDVYSGTITATNGNVSGIGCNTDMLCEGISISSGKITAKTIEGKGRYGIKMSDGVIKGSSSITGNSTYFGFWIDDGSITAPTIYYCGKIRNSGTISGTQKCKSGCTCTN